MPTYEYRCNDCGHHFEVAQRMSDDPLTECEVCGGEVVKVLFAPAIHFKGSGFHNTDYGSRRRSDEGGGSSDGGSSDGGSSNGGAAAGSGDGGSGSSGSSDSSSGSSASSGGSSGKKTVGLDKV